MAADCEPRERLLRALVADHTRDRPGRCGHVPEAGPIIGGDGRRPDLQGAYRNRLARPREDVQVLADDGWPVELCRDQAIAADAGEPDAALGVACDLERRRDGAREILLLDPVIPTLDPLVSAFSRLTASSHGPRSSPGAALICVTRRVAP